MSPRTPVGFLHPGLMGETLAGLCVQPSLWVSAGRSPETRDRAERQGLHEVSSIAELCDRVGIVVSICPPGSAVDVADQVAAADFGGLYVDANAIAPATARRIGELFEHFVDGSVIGPPAHRAGTTRIYLCGERAPQVAELWQGTALDARVLDGPAGAASALKMAYASWTKIGGALQLAIRALATAEGVDAALVEEWAISQPGLAERSERVASGVGPKAWRFVGEMEQISAAFDGRLLPTGFADAAAELYERMAELKGAESPDLADVLRSINPPS